MSIKGNIHTLVEKNKIGLSLFTFLINRISAPKNALTINSIYFRGNEVYISKHGKNQVAFDVGAYSGNCNYWICGNDNSLTVANGTTIQGQGLGQTIHVDGNNNRIVIGKNCQVNISSLFIWGSNNSIIIEDDCSLMLTELHIEQDNNEIHIGKGCTFHGRNGYPVHVAVDEGSKVIFDEDCMCANGIQIRSTDSHSITDLQGNRINPAKDIYIGKHVWIGLGAIILKGTQLMPNSVVAAGGVCSKEFPEGNCIIGGNPAKVIKREISWDTLSVRIDVSEDEKFLW